MRLGTKLTLCLSLIIILVLSIYGYSHVLSRRDILVRKMKVETRSIGRTLKVSLEKVSLTREMEYVQELIDAVEEYEKTLGVIVYHRGKDLVFQSRSLGEVKPYIEGIKRAIQEDLVLEEFGAYQKMPVFTYTFPLQDRGGRNIGGVSVLHHTSFMEEDIQKAKWTIFITIFTVIGGTVALVIFVTRKWINQPVSQLMIGIKNLAKGNPNTQIDLKSGDELSELAKAFNQMAVDLKEAQERIIQGAETRLELERSLRQSEKLATIGQLTSGLAHEIGTPLNIIGGRAELAKRRLEDKEGTEKNLDIIIQQTERITKIIQQLLGFVRKKKPDQKALKISALLETTLDFLGHQIQKQGVRVVKKISDNLPSVIGDPDQLQQVFLNLFLNAIQSMPQGGELRIAVSSKWISKEGLEDSSRPYVEVWVEDTGAGMEREVMENIFNPFFTTKDTGTGLGLMVSQGIVQDHEGWIDVESEMEKGSVFKVYLPCISGEVKRNG
ncbi:MAG: ATP-binding protein [Thermodesulfobacteriota bacterium]|nr:ATP-binding protein [Thermodesulfobacteriota bacterium]